MFSRLCRNFNALSPALISAGDKVLASVVNLSGLGGSLKVRSPARASFLETDVGVSALILLQIVEGSSTILVDDTDWEYCTKLLQNVIEKIGSRPSYTDDACEVLYGRAGFLYALLLIRSALRSHTNSTESASLLDQFLESLERLTSDDNIRAVVGAIIDIGREGAQMYAADIAESGLMIPPLMWVWHSKRYLGAAHGVAGILQMLWSCPSHIVAPYMTDMLGTLMWLVGLQEQSGNWPTKAPMPRGGQNGDNELVQYVHALC
jgi:Lanthionine synthetase C-like protein